MFLMGNMIMHHLDYRQKIVICKEGSQVSNKVLFTMGCSIMEVSIVDTIKNLLAMIRQNLSEVSGPKNGSKEGKKSIPSSTLS